MVKRYNTQQQTVLDNCHGVLCRFCDSGAVMCVVNCLLKICTKNPCIMVEDRLLH